MFYNGKRRLRNLYHQAKFGPSRAREATEEDAAARRGSEATTRVLRDAGGDRQYQRGPSGRPANKRLFHCPHYNWFTAFLVCLSIRAAVKWLGKALS